MQSPPAHCAVIGQLSDMSVDVFEHQPSQRSHMFGFAAGGDAVQLVCWRRDMDAIRTNLEPFSFEATSSGLLLLLDLLLAKKGAHGFVETQPPTISVPDAALSEFELVDWRGPDKKQALGSTIPENAPAVLHQAASSTVCSRQVWRANLDRGDARLLQKVAIKTGPFDFIAQEVGLHLLSSGIVVCILLCLKLIIVWYFMTSACQSVLNKCMAQCSLTRGPCCSQAWMYQHLAGVPGPVDMVYSNVDEAHHEPAFLVTSPFGRCLEMTDEAPFIVGALACAAKTVGRLADLYPPVLHRDLSLGNIIVVEETLERAMLEGKLDGAYLLDLATAREAPGGRLASTSIEELTGTPLFMAIGILEGEPHTVSTDLESLFMVLVYLGFCGHVHWANVPPGWRNASALK